MPPTETGKGLVAPPVAGDATVLSSLRAALERADYTTERIEATLGVGELSAAPGEVAVHRRRLEGDDPFSTVAMLFILGDAVDTPAASAAFAPLSLESLAAAGVLEEDHGVVRPLVRLLPHGDYYLASDRVAIEPSADWVAGIHAPSVTLAKLAVRRQARATLDLGTGCGIQALLAARHSTRVVATDVNERALVFARFNAALNGIEGIEVRRGHLLEPVGADERFDLVVANPPYVISPDATYVYRDSGLPRDDLCRELVQAVPGVLAEGGFAHVLVSWVQRTGEDDEWAESLRTWVDGTGCDAWLLRYKAEDPLAHTAGWLGPLAWSEPDEHEAALDRWLDYFRAQEIEAVGYGAVVLRRRSSTSNWVRLDEIPIERLEPATEHTLRVFAAEDYLATLPGESALLDDCFELVDTHRLEQELVCRDGRFYVESQTLVLTDGLAFRAGLDRSTVMLLPHFHAGRRLAEVLAVAASDLAVEDEDRERFAVAGLAVARRLLELGFLVRSGG